MSTDRKIEDVIAIGEKNRRTMELVRNWCAHVSTEKYGGIGLVEAQTGLPIGHHFLKCPHALAGGMAAWDLADTALDFYDRNCVDCKLRKPVGLPNLMSLVAERNAVQEKQRQAQERAERETAERLAMRERARAEIRPRLDTMAATTLDQISELDRSKGDDAVHRLVKTAELAPETFAPDTIDHLFSLVNSREYWLIEPALQVLAKLPVDPAWLCNAALRALHTFYVRDTAATIVRERCSHADSTLIPGALPTLISLANPTPLHFGYSRPITPFAAPLHEVFRRHPAAVKNGIRALLDEKGADSVRTAARGLETLADQDLSLLELLRCATDRHGREGQVADPGKGRGRLRGDPRYPRGRATGFRGQTDRDGCPHRQLSHGRDT